MTSLMVFDTVMIVVFGLGIAILLAVIVDKLEEITEILEKMK